MTSRTQTSNTPLHNTGNVHGNGAIKESDSIMDSHCRRYLDNDGFGAGTPGQRQRQHQQIRAMQAAESVRKHRVEKMREKDEDAWVGVLQ